MVKLEAFEILEHYELLSKSRPIGREAKNWLSSVYCKRRDTGEFIKNCQLNVTALTDAGAREAAESRARAELVPKLNALGKPLDWDSEVRKILIAAYKSRRSFEAFIIRELKKPPERDGLLDNFGPARQRYLQESINICARLEKLSEGQRIEALTSPDEVFEDPSDGWSLQDLDSRIDIYRYFLNPSQSETDAHQDQLRRLQNRYAELGWE